MNKNLKITINQELAVRLIISGIALLNGVMDMIGGPHLIIGDDQVSSFVSVIFLVASFIWVLWKNNNFTQASKEGQEVTDILKRDPDAVITVETNEE